MKSVSVSFLFLLIIALMMMCSCNIINPPETIPAYIEVDSFSVYTKSDGSQGSSSSNIADVWVTVDGNFLSGYQLGTKVPVLYNGTHDVTLRAGILLNGIDGTRVPYGVFQPFDTTINLIAGQIHKIIPRVTYYSYTHFPLIEDFDHSSFFFKADSTSDTTLTIVTDTNSIDHNSGGVFLDGNHPFFECTTIDSFNLPGGTVPTYIELNYKCNNEFTVGVSANTQLGPITAYDLLNIRSTDVWKKIYINLTPIVLQAQHAIDWRIYIKATKADGQTTASLYFDNIKLVY